MGRAAKDQAPHISLFAILSCCLPCCACCYRWTGPSQLYGPGQRLLNASLHVTQWVVASGLCRGRQPRMAAVMEANEAAAAAAQHITLSDMLWFLPHPHYEKLEHLLCLCRTL